MTPAERIRQAERRRTRRLHLLAVRRAIRMAETGTLQVPVVRMSEPPLPETLAYVRAQYGPHAVVVVEPGVAS